MVNTIHDIKAALAEEIVLWEKMGNPCLLSRFVLRHGKIMAGDRRPRGIRKRRNKECFKNTAEAVLYGWNDYQYYEGLVLTRIVPLLIHHAWCVDSMGLVVDLTWLHPEECTYMGVHIPKEELREEILNREAYCSVFDTGRGFNIQYMFGKDPELEGIVKDILARPPLNLDVDQED
jgi:hypothetical protein